MGKIKKSTKKIIFDDLMAIKDLLKSTILQKETDEKKIFEIAIQFQKNALFYDAFLNTGGIDDESGVEDAPPMEKIAIELIGINEKLDNIAHNIKE